MQLTALTALSPLDGRYRNKVSALAPYFSEYGLMRYRVMIEVEYFIALCALPLPQLEKVHVSLADELRTIYQQFSEADANRIKETEKTTNHDVKAV
jgi:adenylosuccinate lyase